MTLTQILIYIGVAGVRYVNRVSNRKKPYRAEIKVEGKTKSLGYYTFPEEAAVAYNRAAIINFGRYAFINTIPKEAMSLVEDKTKGDNDEN